MSWIQRIDKEYKQYIQNRIIEIRSKLPIAAWYHVAGEENLADLPSRGCLPKQLMRNDQKNKWILDAHWLTQDRSEWPIRNNVKVKFEDVELKTIKIKTDVFQSNCLISRDKFMPSVPEVIVFEKYGTLEGLVRTIAWCVRFVKNSL